MRKVLTATLLACVIPAEASAQQETEASSLEDSQDAALRGHILAMEDSHRIAAEELLRQFEADRFAPEFMATTTARQRAELLSAIRSAAGSAGGAMVQPQDDGFELRLVGPREHVIRFAIEDAAPYRLTALSIEEIANLPPITRENLKERIDSYMAEGERTGLVQIRLDGETVFEKAYGMANPQLGSAIDADTVFGIGSRPIDFTIATAMLLAKQEKLSFDDTLADHFDDVPVDRAGMTILHMINGQSGLPDFPANNSDADADLTWITRDEFVSRTMKTPLLFAPGEGRQHSHWAFGVVAAIVEKTSGKSYSAFLRENFFDPAGMKRTGNYGETRGLPLEAFAVGGGNRVGLPNIPPNWGPTSWLVLGSGGMFSTLNDLRRFYEFIARGGVLADRHAVHFHGPNVQIDGSDRGFELLSINNEGRTNEAWVLLNRPGGPGALDPLVRPLQALIEGD